MGIIGRESSVDFQREVIEMKFDIRLMTGILLGTVVGLNYHETLSLYLPVLTIGALIMLLRVIRP